MPRVAVNFPPSKSDTSAWIARQIREAREDERLTQAELAARLDRTQTAVSYWESGKRVPALDDLIDISVAVGKDVYFFLPQTSRHSRFPRRFSVPRPPGSPIASLITPWARSSTMPRFASYRRSASASALGSRPMLRMS